MDDKDEDEPLEKLQHELEQRMAELEYVKREARWAFTKHFLLFGSIQAVIAVVAVIVFAHNFPDDPLMCGMWGANFFMSVSHITQLVIRWRQNVKEFS